MRDSIGDERFEQLRPGFRRWLFRSCVLLLAAITTTALTYGEAPIFKINSMQRTAVALLGGIALIGFAFTGGLLLGERLLRRYSSAWRANSD